jgi:leucyl/phenylalanyl-tRNA--protein transferase
MARLDPETLIEAYCNGVFPMADADGKVRWYTADPRGIFPLDQFHVPANLAQFLRSPKNDFEIRINHNFEKIMRACMEQRTGRTWINQQMIDAYLRLHELKLAHSVEIWRHGELAGGLYGVSIRGAFFGESMFHYVRDASKIALVHLVQRLRERGYELLDSQASTPHLSRFGCIEISAEDYADRLRLALEKDCTFA